MLGIDKDYTGYLNYYEGMILAVSILTVFAVSYFIVKKSTRVKSTGSYGVSGLPDDHAAYQPYSRIYETFLSMDVYDMFCGSTCYWVFPSGGIQRKRTEKQFWPAAYLPLLSVADCWYGCTALKI